MRPETLKIRNAAWHKQYKALLKFKKKHGHCNVPIRHVKGKSLGKWVVCQRILKKANYMRRERGNLLDKIGFQWRLQRTWEENFNELSAFKKKHGNLVSNPPRKYLYEWMQTQRRSGEEQNLSKERRAKLEAIGFPWKLYVVSCWESNYQRLVNFKKRHGHCEVPYHKKKNRSLFNWLHYQRRSLVEKRLKDYKKSKLSSIGFNFTRLKEKRLKEYKKSKIFPVGFNFTLHCGRPDTNWNKMYSALSDFKKKNGHCSVPQNYPLNPELGMWVALQRKRKSKNKCKRLSIGKIKLLDKIGFPWDARSARWKRMYFALVEFKSIHGHCNVSSRDKNRKLVHWVRNKRVEFKKGKLSPERIKKLNDIGFMWKDSWSKLTGKLELSRLADWLKAQKRRVTNKKMWVGHAKKLREIGFRVA